MIKISYSDRFEVDLPNGHRFPMLKYQLVRQQLLLEGVVNESQLFEPDFIPEDIILLTHSPDYWHRIKNLALTEREMRKIGFPQSQSLVRRSHHSASGTLYSALNALRDKIGINIAGGTHHAYAEHGEGFCILNDVAIASNYLLAQNLVQRILIIDLDVHQGNGSAVLFANNPAVFTLSVHCTDNYPLHKEQSDLDISLPSGTTDEVYISELERVLPLVLTAFKPEFIFYIAGVDVLKTDKLGNFSLSHQGCAQRDKIVLNYTYQLKIPITIVMGGGYSEKYTDIITAHVNTFKYARELFD